MTTDGLAFPNVKLFWELDGHLLLIAISGPDAFLVNFSSPGEMLQRFLEALSANGLDTSNTVQIKTTLNRDGATFMVKWVGDIGHAPEARTLVPGLGHLLGVRVYGDSE